MLTEVKDENFEYIITCHVPMCPHCGGALHNKTNLTIYKCNDCQSIFKVDRSGQAEHEMVCKEIFLNPEDRPTAKVEPDINMDTKVDENITGDKTT